MEGNSARFAAPRPTVCVQVKSGDVTRTHHFSESFHIGRDDDCAVCIKHDYVSRHHAEVLWRDGSWWLQDLDSANGVYSDKARIASLPLTGRNVVRLGRYGPSVSLEVEDAVMPVEDAEAAAAKRYFESSGHPGGFSDRTIVIRRAFENLQKRQRRRYRWVVGGLALLAVGAAIVATIERRKAGAQQAQAENLFYLMKALDIQLARMHETERVHDIRSQRLAAERDYDKYLETLDIYAGKLPDLDRRILRVTRVFGECELTMPPGYVAEVKRFIGLWQGSGRFAQAVAAAQSMGYGRRIGDEFLRNGLPPEFFYLALQESAFDTYAVGPPTAYGYAKGMWQFIPKTGARYGLRMGPQEDRPVPDPGDERSDAEKATRAAAAYIKDLYATDAQASGLMVMACYNWGERNVLPFVTAMPLNPRERNFWQLLTVHRRELPEETYNYVFSIVAAAVIGQDPRRFGFDVDSPLAYLERR